MLGILEFLTMSSSGLTRGSLFCDVIPRSGRGMTRGLGILEFRVYCDKSTAQTSRGEPFAAVI